MDNLHVSVVLNARAIARRFVLVHDDIVVLFIPVPLIILPSTELSPVTDYIGLNSVSV